MNEENDHNTNILFLKKTVRSFCEEREWDKFHNPKDLSIGIITEASELLEHFRFKTYEECESIMKDAKERDEVALEMADILFFLLRMAQKYDIDITDYLLKKIEINGERYPVEKSRGRNLKYNEI